MDTRRIAMGIEAIAAELYGGRRRNASFKTTPSVYVGTYAKYNAGDLTGEWVDLTDFDGKSDFIDYCLQLHSDEDDPELMFQDYEGFPEKYYSQSGIDAEVWDYIAKCGKYDQEVVDAVVEDGWPLGKVDDTIYYKGCHTMEEVAEKYIDSELGGLDQLPVEELQRYFDYESYGRDLEAEGGFIQTKNGYVWIFNQN